MNINYSDIYQKLKEISSQGSRPALLAIDGRCASGKSTLAAKLAADWDANLFHMDDFFLQPHQRTAERLAEPGGNVDRERFLTEVLQPLHSGQPVSYRRFHCKTFTFDPEQIIEPKPISLGPTIPLIPPRKMGGLSRKTPSVTEPIRDGVALSPNSPQGVKLK